MRTYFAVAKSHFVLNALMYNKKSLFLVKVERIYQGLCLYNCNIFFYKCPVHSTFYICAVRIRFAVQHQLKLEIQNSITFDFVRDPRMDYSDSSEVNSTLVWGWKLSSAYSHLLVDFHQNRQHSPVQVFLRFLRGLI